MHNATRVLFSWFTVPYAIIPYCFIILPHNNIQKSAESQPDPQAAGHRARHCVPACRNCSGHHGHTGTEGYAKRRSLPSGHALLPPSPRHWTPFAGQPYIFHSLRLLHPPVLPILSDSVPSSSLPPSTLLLPPPSLLPSIRPPSLPPSLPPCLTA